jgi:DNA-binding response OmpR family regulator
MARPSRILIVDDEPFNVDYLEQELEHLGYETESASDGRQALEKVALDAPDLILLDIMMPGIDGFTVCRMLKDDRKTRRIPIVIMTALNAFEDRVKGIEAGADDFLTKPVDDRELVARIKTALRVKHAVDDEIGELRKISDHLAKFVPDSVRNLIAANPDSPELEKREQDVSILFADITGYTRLSELMAAEVLNLMVERYFSSFLDCIHNVDGEISETSGDGLMAIFPDSDQGGRHGLEAPAGERGAQPGQHHPASRGAHRRQLGAGAGGLDPFRRAPRHALGLHGGRPGHQPGGPSRQSCRGRRGLRRR